MKWRRYNLGANNPSDFGLFFSWGNIDGHLENSGYNFSQEVYDETIAASISANLTLEQDAAKEILGSNWRIPTASEFQELFDNCSSIWTTFNGVVGRLFTSNINRNVVFIPAAGLFDGTSHNGKGLSGHYWSSTYVSTTNARSFDFNSSGVYAQDSRVRHDGFSIRPVYDENQNRSIIPPTPEDEPKEEETPTVEEPKDDNER